MSFSNWFPRPKAPAGIFNTSLSTENIFSSHEIFEMLQHQSAVEWRDKVGIFPPADGAESTSVRLLKSGDWVFKTSASQSSKNIESLLTKINESMAKAVHYKIGHPQKFWFIFQAEGFYWACSACPRLRTLRQLKTWEGKVQWWAQMLLLGLKVMNQYKISLELSPANFGFPAARDRLYYLDENILPLGAYGDLGEALAKRVPEEPEISEQQWCHLGAYVKKVLEPHFSDAKDWGKIIEGVQHYLLPVQYHHQRKALLEGLLGMETLFESFASSSKSQKSAPANKVCVFADVHGNLPALEAVLKEAKNLGAEKFIFLGDAVGLGPYPRECVQRIGNLPDVMFVQGNHDNSVGSAIVDDLEDEIIAVTAKWSRDRLHTEEISWLLKMPLEHTVDDLMIVHGSPTDPVRFYNYINETTSHENLAFMAKNGLKVLFYGHTHIPFIHRQNGRAETVAIDTDRDIQLFKNDELLLLNPGSVGQPRDGDPRASFAIWDLKSNMVNFRRIAYPIKETTTALNKSNLPGEVIFSLTSRLETGR